MSEVKPRQRLSTEERQDEIVKAAVELAGAHGIDNVTTQEIAEVVGVTQGAIFRHFPTKDTIWVAVVHWIRGRLIAQWQCAVFVRHSALSRALQLQSAIYRAVSR